MYIIIYYPIYYIIDNYILCASVCNEALNSLAGLREIGLAGLRGLILLAGAAELRTGLWHDVRRGGACFMRAAFDAPRRMYLAEVAVRPKTATAGWDKDPEG